MPADHGGELHHGQSGLPTFPNRAQPSPEQAVRRGQLEAFDGALQDAELMPQGEEGSENRPQRKSAMSDNSQFYQPLRILRQPQSKNWSRRDNSSRPMRSVAWKMRPNQTWLKFTPNKSQRTMCLPNTWSEIRFRLNIVIEFSKPGLVGFLRGRRLILGFLCLEACLLPDLPGDDRMIGRRESFLCANGGDPLIHRGFVNLLQEI